MSEFTLVSNVNTDVEIVHSDGKNGCLKNEMWQGQQMAGFAGYV